MNGLMGALRVKRAVIVIGVTVGMEKFIVVVRAVGVRSGVFGALWFMCASGAVRAVGVRSGIFGSLWFVCASGVVRVFGAECCRS